MIGKTIRGTLATIAFEKSANASRELLGIADDGAAHFER